jgi:hypothetical protein
MSGETEERKKKSVALQFCKGDLMDSWGHECGPREAVSSDGISLFLFERDGAFYLTPSFEEAERVIVPVQENPVPYLVRKEDLDQPRIQLGELYADLHGFMSDYYVHRQSIKK